MRRFDLSPFHSSSIGFDRIFSLLAERAQPEINSSYPPYNIEKGGENAYRISLAVAGFEEAELSIETQENALIVRGVKADETKVQPGAEFVFQGIAARNFERRFQLADYVEVREASLKTAC